MTVETTTDRASYATNGTTGPFTIPFYFLANDQVQVIYATSAGVETTLTLTVDYNVTGAGDEAGGALTLVTSIAAGGTLTILRDVPATQLTDYLAQDAFPAESHEAALDKLTMLAQQALQAVDRTIRFPQSETITSAQATLPAKASRLDKLLTFDATTGLPIMSNFTHTQVASAVAAAYLAGSTADAVAFVPAGTGAVATTMQAKGRERHSVLGNGASTANSAAANSTAFNLAALSGNTTIVVPPGTYALDPANPVLIQDGQTWIMDGANFTFVGSTGKIFYCLTVDDWSFKGNFSITGDGKTIGTAVGIWVSDCARWHIDTPKISNIRGWPFYMEPGVSTTQRGQHGTLANPVFYDCYYGYEDAPGTGAEYCTILNPRIYGCVIHGLKTRAGNTLVIGGHIVDNLAKGVHLAAGSNSAHGIFSGVNINHNVTYNLHAEGVLNGFTFNGCHFYEGDIWFDRSKGIHILGGNLDPHAIYNYKDGTSGINVIDGCFCPGGYGPIRAVGSNDGHNELIVRNLWGAGSYADSGGKDTAGLTFNDPSMCYAQVTRDVGASQSLTSGVASTLTYSTANYLFDRRDMLAEASGTFTIPAGLSGLYRIALDLLFAGTAMSTTASFVQVKVNGNTKRLCTPTVFSTTTLKIDSAFDIYLTAADVVIVEATITGTTPTFGNATWASTVSLSKIA